MSQVETEGAAPPNFLFGRTWLDTRSRVSVWSAFAIFIGLSGLLLLVAGFGLASDGLLKLGCINVIAGIGVGLFCGGTGILSLGHVVFFGVGGYVASWFTIPVGIKATLLPDMPAFIVETQWPLWLAIFPAIGAAMVVGAITGLVMRRLRDTSAVIASFSFLAIAYLLFIGLTSLTNGKQALYGLPKAGLSWPLLMIAVAAALAIGFIVKSGVQGKNAEAFRENEAAARSIGINPDRAILTLWIVSAGIMGLAGALFVHAVGIAAPSAFYLDKTFALIVMIIVGGYRSLTGAVVGAVVVTVAEEIFKKTEELLSAYSGQKLFFDFTMPPVFGLTAFAFSLMILLVLYYRPEGVAGYNELADMPWFRRLFGGWLKQPQRNAAPAHYNVPNSSLLKTVNLTKFYGAFQAMSEINLEVPAGHIVGLIGPNGAGKSTFINVITGNLFATTGEINLNGEDATLWGASTLAQSGLGRTFQNIRVFRSLSALENVAVAVNVARPELGRFAGERLAFAWLKTLGLEDLADDAAGSLAYGDQRRLEIARALALQPHFLLLDEPAAGMNNAETEALTRLLKKVVSEIGCGILLVEHDLPMVMALCDKIYVVNKGEQIAQGTPQEVRTDPHVIEAYIGEELDNHD